MITAKQIQKRLRAKASAKKAKDLSWFFKTKPGEYGEGDRFLGIVVPDIRASIKGCEDISFLEIGKLLASLFHEDRLAGVLLLVAKSEHDKKAAYDFYLKKIDRMNNWDLVDLSAPKVVGGYLLKNTTAKKNAILQKLSSSKNMWHRRVAILATFMFVREEKFGDTLALAKKYLRDREDLMHKATGWALREVGKRSETTLKKFLNKYASVMPRTMLRYSLERLPEADRKRYMTKQ